MKELKIGMIGTDTSHTTAFAKLLNDAADQFHIPGGRVTKALRFSSPDFELSYSRVDKFCSALSEQFNVEIIDQLDEIINNCDAILLESADGRVHLEQFRQIVETQKPIFIDKPFALSLDEAVKMNELAMFHKTPIMSTSALRYAAALEEGLKLVKKEDIQEVIIRCPLYIEPTQKRYFWYGIHGVEMLYRVLGTGCQQVSVERAEQEDQLVGQWINGIVGKVKCSHKLAQAFELDIVTATQTHTIEINAAQKPFYASLLEEVIQFFHSKTSPIAADETLEVIAFLEAAEKSYSEQSQVMLEDIWKCR